MIIITYNLLSVYIIHSDEICTTAPGGGVEWPTIISVTVLWIRVVLPQSRTHLRDFIKLLTPGQTLIRPTHPCALYLTVLGSRLNKCVCVECLEFDDTNRH